MKVLLGGQTDPHWPRLLAAQITLLSKTARISTIPVAFLFLLGSQEHWKEPQEALTSFPALLQTEAFA